MEPKILLIGRRPEVVDIIAEELKKHGRDIVGASEQEKIEQLLNSREFDFVVMGAGLPDHQRDYLTSFIQSIKPELQVYMIERKGQEKPYKLVNFANNQALEFKIDRLSKRKASAK